MKNEMKLEYLRLATRLNDDDCDLAEVSQVSIFENVCRHESWMRLRGHCSVIYFMCIDECCK